MSTSSYPFVVLRRDVIPRPSTQQSHNNHTEVFTVLRNLSYEVPNTAKTEDIIARVRDTIHEYDRGLSPDTRPIVELYQVK